MWHLLDLIAVVIKLINKEFLFDTFLKNEFIENKSFVKNV